MLKLTAPLSFFLFIVFFLVFSCASCFAAIGDNGTDYADLIAFRSGLVLEAGDILSTNWTSGTHYCDWFGVSCTKNRRVRNLQLPGLGLRGQLSAQIANLSRLEELDLSRNQLGGFLPSELGSLQQLRILNVARNSFVGAIPANLSRCWKLEQLILQRNSITGTIPPELGSLSNLVTLQLQFNSLTGTIPPELGQLTRISQLVLSVNNLTGSIPLSICNSSTLEMIIFSRNTISGQLPDSLGYGLPNLMYLALDTNQISGKIPESLVNATNLELLALDGNYLDGEIPSDFGRLLNIKQLWLHNNQLSGGIPHGIFNITSLLSLFTLQNNLSGVLPPDLGNWLPNIMELDLSVNLFTGSIPSSICNATKLNTLDLQLNSFNGPVPMMLGNLVDLQRLNLLGNQLTNNPRSTHLDFLNSLASCRNLEYLILDSNPLNGILPESVANLSTSLGVFTARLCDLKGGIPSGFGNLSNLDYLGLDDNNLQGTVPLSFSGLKNLERLYLMDNTLEGSIPTEFCSMQIMGYLGLSRNRFSGSIPICFRNLTQLREISLSNNRLNSTVPLDFWKLENLRVLNLSTNLLYGSIPPEVGNLKAITTVDLSFNDFSGDIPNSIGSLQNLLTLNMSRNNFEGPIPNAMSNLIVIQSLDLSSNALSGEIPPSLGSLLDLQYLNLSFNRLQGEIPNTGVFANISFQSLMGNPNLCGAPNLSFPLCPPPQASGHGKRRASFVLKITIPISATALLLFAMVILWIKFSFRKRKITTETEISPVGHQFISYHQLVRATEDFSTSNLLGEGSSGKVYKGQLLDGTVAAIKVFNMQYAKALKNFDAECEVFSQVRHRNLVKIISTCSNLDFKAMILEFMPNGSLDMMLYSQSTVLSLVQRLDIVCDVALATGYLHHEYIVPIVHCDLKPANVLLDEDMTAHVADFGISKILAQDQEFVQTNTLGTIGYMAPEYGLDGHVSTKGDVYSFGILLLETFTGKRPADDMFNEDLSLHQWVSQVFPDGLLEVLDSNLFPSTSSLNNVSTATRENEQLQETLVPIIRVALLCLEEVPEERIEMKAVVVQLKKIRAELKKRTATCTTRLPRL